MCTTIRPLSPRLQEVARTQLNEDPERREQDLTHIKDWIAKQPHLNARTDDQWLLAFLRGCKFSLERTKVTIDSFYTARTLLPEFFCNRDPLLPELQEILKQGNHLALPQLDDDGHRIILNRASGILKAEHQMKVTFMIIEIMMLEDDDYIISGDICLFDCLGASANISQITLPMVKKVLTVMKDAYPLRSQGSNYFNISNIFMKIFNIAQTLLPDKYKKRVSVHYDLESIYKNIPRKNLPHEYGGEAGPLKDLTYAWKKKVESYREWFIDDEKYKTDETKRPGKPKTQDSMFALDGSFRQLTVD